MNTEISWKKPGILVAILFLSHSGTFAATNDLSATLSKGLFEEEANHNLAAAIQVYQSVIDRFDADRKLAATAVFRLGECYRKQGSTNQAVAQYQRILREFADQTALVALSKQLEANYPGLMAATAGRSDASSPAPAADAEEISRVQAIIKNSPDLINAPDQSGRTLLQSYAGRGDFTVVKLLLDSGAAVNGIRQPELTPLHYAAGNGHKAVVDLLLSKGAKTDVKTESGVTPLHIAVSKGYELVARDLLEAGAPVNAQVEQNVNRANSAELQGGSLSYELHAGQTPLQIACEKGYHSLVDLLLAKGADVNANNGAALNAASSANDEVLAKTLLAAHADPALGGGVALKSATRAGSVPMLDLLLAHCANPDLTSLLEQAIASKQSQIIKKLIALKADPNARYPNGTPFFFSTIPDPPSLAAFLDGGADPNARDRQGQSALLAALSGNNEQALELLLTHGADPNPEDPSQGFTPLHSAIGHGNVKAVKLLLQHGAKVNAQDKAGVTPLYNAVSRRNQEIAEVLLDNGADPNLHDNNGQTPLDVAKSFSPGQPGYARTAPVLRLPGTPGSEPPATRNISMVDLLREHGASEDLPRLDRIEVRRFPNYTSTVFLRSTNDLNRFSLAELLAVHYGLISASPDPRKPRNGATYNGNSDTIVGSLPFPDLDKINIRRANADGKGWNRIPVPAQLILEVIWRKNDLDPGLSSQFWLQWGDQVEIPEADHPLDETWKGFPPQVVTNLQKCLQRQVSLTIKGQTTNLVLQVSLPEPAYFAPPGPLRASSFNYSCAQFCLAPTLESSGLMRTSSDVAHVKVTRHNQATHENWDRVFDCSGTAGYPDLWLRDGDIIDVPDKP